MAVKQPRLTLEFHPATPDRWPDLERLFGERGACGGCWCMTWRLPRADFDAGKGEAHQSRLRLLVIEDRQPGVLAYTAGEPIGWCAVAPREEYVRLEKSRALKPIDDRPVWSVTCLFVRRDFRHKGVSVELLKAAIRHVEQQGGQIVEGYPVEPKKGEMPAAFAWTGLLSAFPTVGFVEAARGSPSRPIVRDEIRPKAKQKRPSAVTP